MTAGYQPDWLHCALKRSRAFPGTKRRHSEPLKQLLFVWTQWIDRSVITCKADAGRAITLTGDRVMRENGRGKPEPSTCRTGSILSEWSRDMDRMVWGCHWDGPVSLCAHTICHPSWPCPTDPVSRPEHVTHFDVPLLAAESWLQHLLLNLETNRFSKSQWWMVSRKDMRSRISQTLTTSSSSMNHYDHKYYQARRSRKKKNKLT